MKYLANLVLTEAEFTVLRHACADDPAFPLTWQIWLDLADAAQVEALAAGMSVPPLTVDADEFLGWCHQIGIMAGLDALRAYGLVMRKRADAVGKLTSPTSGDDARPRWAIHERSSR